MKERKLESNNREHKKMSSLIESERQPIFRRREKLRLALHRSMPTITIPVPPVPRDRDPKPVLKTIDVHDLAQRILNPSNYKPFLLLDCRGYLCYWQRHISEAVHIACTDRFNRKRLRSVGSSVLDLMSTNNRINQSQEIEDLTEVIVYDEGISDLNLLEDAALANAISFVLQKLLLEKRQPVYLKGGFREFSLYYSNLIESCANQKDLSMEINLPLQKIPTLSLANTNFLPPFSPNSAPTSYCDIENEPPTQILPFLYVGNAKDANNLELLEQLGISYVLSATNVVPNRHSYPSSNFISNGESTSERSKNLPNNENALEFQTKLVEVSDNLCENLIGRFEECIDFIDEARQAGKRVLIHCHAGISRSPTIAIAYLMHHLNLKTFEAYGMVQNCRKIISPNLNFMGQLLEFEGILKRKQFLSSTESSLSTSSNSATSSVSDPLTDDIDMGIGP